MIVLFDVGMLFFALINTSKALQKKTQREAQCNEGTDALCDGGCVGEHVEQTLEGSCLGDAILLATVLAA